MTAEAGLTNCYIWSIPKTKLGVKHWLETADHSYFQNEVLCHGNHFVGHCSNVFCFRNTQFVGFLFTKEYMERAIMTALGESDHSTLYRA